MTDTSSRPSPRPAWQIWCAALCVALLTFAVFFTSTRFGFVGFDDADNVYNNPFLNPVTSKSVPRFWSESYYELYTPVTYTLWTAVASRPESRLAQPVKILSGGDSTLKGQPFHLLGVSLHVLNSVLLFFILARLPILRDRPPWFAALGAMFWAVHPLQAESVAWVTGHNNVFSGTFMLAALLTFLNRHSARSELGRLGWFLLSSVFYALALLAKPTAAALPLVAFALSIGAYRQPVRALILPLVTWLALAGGLLFLTRTTVSKVTDVSLPVWQRPFVIGDGLAFYAGKILLPIRLGIDYGRQPEWLRTQAWFYAMWLIPVAIGAVLVWWYRRTAERDSQNLAAVVLAGFAVFVLGALPMLGLVPYYFHHYSTVADRYVYLALIGVAVAVAAVPAHLSKSTQQVVTGIAAAVVLCFSYQCYRQSLVWHDSETLFRNAAIANPDSKLGHYNTALVLVDKGDHDGALQEVEAAMKCRPEGKVLESRTYQTRSAIFFDRGRYGEAIQDSREAIRLSPSDPTNYINLAVILWRAGEKDTARVTLETALKVSGSRRNNVYTVAAKMLQQEIPELGTPYMEEAAKDSPQAADANFILGVLAGNRKDNTAAEKYLRNAVRLAPESGQMAYTLARILERSGKANEAKQYYAKAAALGYKAQK